MRRKYFYNAKQNEIYTAKKFLEVRGGAKNYFYTAKIFYTAKKFYNAKIIYTAKKSFNNTNEIFDNARKILQYKDYLYCEDSANQKSYS